MSRGQIGGTNSGQTSKKCCDLYCDVESLPLKNYKDLTMKLKLKNLFPNSSSETNVYIYQLPEGLGMREVLAHGISMQKNPQTREEISSMILLTPKLSIIIRQQIDAKVMHNREICKGKPYIVTYFCL